MNSLSNKWFNKILNDLVAVIVVPDQQIQSLEDRIRSQGIWLQIRESIAVQVWGVTQVQDYYRSLVEEGNFQRLEILI